MTWICAATGINMALVAGDSRISTAAGDDFSQIEVIKCEQIGPQTAVAYAGTVLTALDLIEEIRPYKAEPYVGVSIIHRLQDFVSAGPRGTIRGLGSGGCELLFVDLGDARPETSGLLYAHLARLTCTAAGQFKLTDLREYPTGEFNLTFAGKGETAAEDLGVDVVAALEDRNRLMAFDGYQADMAGLQVATSMDSAVRAKYRDEDIGGYFWTCVVSLWGTSIHRLPQMKFMETRPTLGLKDPRPDFTLLHGLADFEAWVAQAGMGAAMAASITA